MLGNQSRAL